MSRTYAFIALASLVASALLLHVCVAPPRSSGEAGQPVLVSPALNEPVAFCFAPGTDPEVMAHYNQIMQTDPSGARYQLAGRWSGGQGNPRALSWSFVPDGLSMEGGNSELFSRMDELFATQGGRATWISRIQSCFDRWAALTGTSYTRITVGGDDWDDGAGWGSSGSASRGDVRIGMVPVDGNFSVLAYNYYPSNGDMVLDRDENWASGSAQANRFLRNVVMHEHGHGLGIAHVCSSDSTQLMEPFLNTLFDGPRDDDLRGVQRHYGDDYEPNDTSAAAADLGVVEVGSAVTRGPVPAPNIASASVLSLDADGKNDYFSFTLTGDRAATITVTPIGRNYDNSSQNGDGSCNSGNPISSLTMANLNVQLIGTDGTSVLATGAVQPAGVAETISNLLVEAGTYSVRVYEEGAPTQAQFYSLSVSAAFLDCNQNSVGDPCDLSCGAPGGVCDVPGCGLTTDCNANATPDDCEFSQSDCNSNGVLDGCDIAGGFSLDSNANGVPDECEIPAATVTSALSRQSCDIALALAPSITTEPRQNGISEIRITFSAPPGGGGASPVGIEQKQCSAPESYAPYAGAAVVNAAIVGHELVLSFSPTLENLRTYRLNIGSSVTSIAGQFVEVRGLVGDVNSDGLVNGADRSVIVGVWTGSGFSCSTDVNSDGQSNGGDRSIVVGAWTGGQDCAP